MTTLLATVVATCFLGGEYAGLQHEYADDIHAEGARFAFK